MSYLSAPSIILILRWTLLHMAHTAAQKVFSTYGQVPSSDNHILEACQDAQSRYVFLKGPTKVGEEIARVKAIIDDQPAQTYQILKEGSETPFFVDENSGRISVKRPDKLSKNSLPHNLTIKASFNKKSCYIQVHVLPNWLKERTFYIPPTSPQLRSSANLEIGTYSQFSENFDVIPYPTAPASTNTIASVYNDLKTNKSLVQPTYDVTYVTFPPFSLSVESAEQPLAVAPFPPRQGILPQPSGNPSQQPLGSLQNTASPPIAFMPPGSSSGYGNQQNPGQPSGTPSGLVCSTCRRPPVCSQPLYTAIIPESATVGTSVLRTSATGQGLQWTISDTAFERFSINPTTGEVSVAGSLRRRTRAAMEFKIRATDMFGLWCDSIVRINVVADGAVDGNPNNSGNSGNSQPYFLQNYYYFAIQCGAGPQRVGSVLATDLDIGQTITYQLINTNEFTVDSSGNIQTTGTIQTSTDRTFYIVATDNGTPPQSATTTVTITVSGTCSSQTRSNTPPTFGQSTYTLSASCRVNNVFAGMITATDYERDTVTYSLRDSQEFTINPTTGELRSQGILSDSRPRTVYVIATDNGQPPMSSMVTVTVNVVNCLPLNNPPAFGQSSYQFTLQCSSAASGTVVGLTQAYDTDGNSITYSISGSQEFIVNPSSGSITLSFPPQTAGVRQFSVVAADNGQPSLSVTAAITVIISGNCQQTQTPIQTFPTQPSIQYPTQPPIQYPTQPPIQYPTQPPIQYPTQPPIQYPTQPPIQYPTQPPIQYLTQPPIQYPTQSPIQFSTQPTPPPFPTQIPVFTQPFTNPTFPTQQPSFSFPPSINTLPTTQFPPQTDRPNQPRPPVFSSQTYLFVAPCTNGTLTQLGSVQAVDPKGTSVTYNVISGSPGFDVDYMTGVVVSLAPITDLGPRSVVVVATDSGNPRTSATTTVQIIVVGPCSPPSTPSQTFTFPPTFPTFPPTQSPPIYFPTPSVTQSPPIFQPTFRPTQAPPLSVPPRFSQASYSFLMTCPLNSNQLIGVVQATSPQAQIITYSISGTNDFIVSTSGEVRTTRLLTGPVVATFQVTATDNVGGMVSVQVQVSIPACQPINQPPSFPQSSYTFSVTCPNSPNILISTVAAQSIQPQALTYNLISTNQFSVDNRGEIRSTALLGSGQSYSFTITVSDSRNPQLSASAQVTVNVGFCQNQPTQPPITFPTPTLPPNQPPYFTVPSYSFTAVCNSQPGTAIGSVYAFDDRTTVNYSLQSQMFGINSITGDIRTTSQIVSSSPITFTVVATDAQGLAATASVTVSVTGCNGPAGPSQPPTNNPQAPIINGPLTVTFTNCDQSTGLIATGTQVGGITATSAFGNNGRLQYSLTGDGRFTASPYNGQIYTTTSIDSGSYLFVVQVADLSTAQAGSATATFSLVVDCSSAGYRPCNPPYIETSISENAQVGTPVIGIASSGTGTGTSSSRPYSGPNSSSGSLNYVSSSVYGTNQPGYAVVGGTYRRAVRHAAIHGRRSNVSEHAPKKYKQMGFATGLQPDRSNSVERGYFIHKASVAGVFRIDSTTGQIYLAQPLDREQMDSYVLKIRSSNGGQYCVTKVGIEVTDINDNAPIFLNQSYVFTAPCGPPNAFVGVITAHDTDSGLRGFVNYSILNSNNPLFGIDCFTGEIRLRRAATPGSLPTTLMIQADNPTSPTQSTTTAVIINPGPGCT